MILFEKKVYLCDMYLSRIFFSKTLLQKKIGFFVISYLIDRLYYKIIVGLIFAPFRINKQELILLYIRC